MSSSNQTSLLQVKRDDHPPLISVTHGLNARGSVDRVEHVRDRVETFLVEDRHGEDDTTVESLARSVRRLGVRRHW
jgi:hypothetical protein